MDEHLRAYVIADNKRAENAGWDESILAIELQHLLSVETEFDITVTGFEIPEINLLLSAGEDTPDAEDVFEIEESAKPGSRRWVISGSWASIGSCAEARLKRFHIQPC